MPGPACPCPRPATRRRDLHVTVNDVALAAVTAGSAHSWSTAASSPIPHAIRSLVPVSAWAGAGVDEPGNRVTLMLADLPVDLDIRSSGSARSTS